MHFAQDQVLQLPMIVLVLGSVLSGFLIAGFLHGTLSLKFFFRNLITASRLKSQNKTNRRSETLLEVAENFLACGHISKAISAYEKFLNTFPNDVNILIRLATILREEGDIARALELD